MHYIADSGGVVVGVLRCLRVAVKDEELRIQDTVTVSPIVRINTE